MFSVFDDIELATLQGHRREALGEALGLTDEQLGTITDFAADRLIDACQELQNTGEATNAE